MRNRCKTLLRDHSVPKVTLKACPRHYSVSAVPKTLTVQGPKRPPIDNSTLYCRDIGAVPVVYCCLSEVTFSLCYIIIFRIWINNHSSNKYHRRWCTLAVHFDWEGHSGVTSVQFGPLACLALWLLTHRMMV